MVDDTSRRAFLWVGREAGPELARRIARAGDRFLRAEAHPHPDHPDSGYVWHILVKGDDGEPREQIAADEDPLNDTWLCPPRCPE